MSMRFWTCSGALLTGGVVLGLVAGGYATHLPPRDFGGPLSDTDTEQATAESDFASVSAADQGPVIIRCKGCGPTLAERRMAADNAGWDPDGMITGASDPVVADYMAQEQPASVPVDYPPSDLHRLPVNIQRFADGQSAPPAQVVATIPTPPPVTRTTDAPAPPRY
ncbi:MAG: hypothetical protein QHC40_13280 [Sphingobium sp.]|nr:hypothetical protein [Sphingobium sp.]